MTRNTRKGCHREKSYHAVEESFGIILESLIEWKLFKDLPQSIVPCVIRYVVCWDKSLLVGKRTYSCELLVIEAVAETETGF